MEGDAELFVCLSAHLDPDKDGDEQSDDDGCDGEGKHLRDERFICTTTHLCSRLPLPLPLPSCRRSRPLCCCAARRVFTSPKQQQSETFFVVVETSRREDREDREEKGRSRREGKRMAAASFSQRWRLMAKSLEKSLVPCGLDIIHPFRVSLCVSFFSILRPSLSITRSD